MKLIIDIPDEDYNVTLKTGFLTTHLAKCPLSLIRHGVPLDNIKAKIKVKEMVETNIERQFYNMALNDAIEVLDNIGEESEE